MRAKRINKTNIWPEAHKLRSQRWSYSVASRTVSRNEHNLSCSSSFFLFQACFFFFGFYASETNPVVSMQRRIRTTKSSKKPTLGGCCIMQQGGRENPWTMRLMNGMKENRCIQRVAPKMLFFRTNQTSTATYWLTGRLLNARSSLFFNVCDFSPRVLQWIRPKFTSVLSPCLFVQFIYFFSFFFHFS